MIKNLHKFKLFSSNIYSALKYTYYVGIGLSWRRKWQPTPVPMGWSFESILTRLIPLCPICCFVLNQIFWNLQVPLKLQVCNFAVLPCIKSSVAQLRKCSPSWAWFFCLCITLTMIHKCRGLVPAFDDVPMARCVSGCHLCHLCHPCCLWGPDSGIR